MVVLLWCVTSFKELVSILHPWLPTFSPLPPFPEISVEKVLHNSIFSPNKLPAGAASICGTQSPLQMLMNGSCCLLE